MEYLTWQQLLADNKPNIWLFELEHVSADGNADW